MTFVMNKLTVAVCIILVVITALLIGLSFVFTKKNDTVDIERKMGIFSTFVGSPQGLNKNKAPTDDDTSTFVKGEPQIACPKGYTPNIINAEVSIYDPQGMCTMMPDLNGITTTSVGGTKPFGQCGIAKGNAAGIKAGVQCPIGTMGWYEDIFFGGDFNNSFNPTGKPYAGYKIPHGMSPADQQATALAAKSIYAKVKADPGLLSIMNKAITDGTISGPSSTPKAGKGQDYDATEIFPYRFLNPLCLHIKDYHTKAGARNVTRQMYNFCEANSKGSPSCQIDTVNLSTGKSYNPLAPPGTGTNLVVDPPYNVGKMTSTSAFRELLPHTSRSKGATNPTVGFKLHGTYMCELDNSKSS